MIAVRCDLCGSDQSRPIYELADHNYGFPGQFTLQKCEHCGLVYLNPRPADEKLPHYYSKAYHPFQSLADSPSAISPVWRQRARDITNLIGPGVVLDVGSGNGHFLVAMRELGWEVHGVEPAQDTARYCQEQLNLDIVVGSIFDIQGTDRYDLITFWDVLEHVPSPKSVLRHAHRLLRDHGALIINLPNWGSIERAIFGPEWIALDAPRHLHHFDSQTLSALVEQNRFKVVQTQCRAPVQSLASNVLRWLGTHMTRGGRSRQQEAPDAKAMTAGNPVKQMNPGKKAAIQLVYWLCRPINALFNILGRGANLTILAQKTR